MENELGPVRDGDWQQTASDRDATSESNDRTSEERDERSEARDERAANREAHAGFDLEAASDRAGARRDRQDSATDRTRAQHDRTAAAADRALAARERSALVVDGLTGTHLRAPGLAELEREIVKAKRTGQPFVLAFIDVDGLKTVNDTDGHDAGDELLRRVVDMIRGSVRAYDLIVRYGGDEFVCGILVLLMSAAAKRFDITREAFVVSRGGSYTVGLAELAPGEELESLISRADAAMYAQRHRRDGGDPAEKPNDCYP